MSTAFDVHDPLQWAAIVPGFHTDGSALAPVAASIAAEEAVRSLRAEGWFHVDAALPVGETRLVLAAVLALRERGLHPVWVWAWDETWRLFLHGAPLWSAILGEGWRILPALWTWYVPAVPGEAGWAPHVDRSKPDIVDADGSPRVISAWIPLTPAVPANGCIYVLPMGHSPSALQKAHVPEIRALPARPGAVLGWNHAVWHWSGRVGPGAPCPRVSVGLELQRGDVPPFTDFVLAPSEIPPLAGRLRLVAAMIRHYAHMTAVDEPNRALASALLR
jgi:hypothetical protein